MKISDLPLPQKIIRKLLQIESFDTLNPPQTAAVKAGLFERKNFLLAIPTASGKTFIAELCALQHIITFRKKVIYLTPLKALALEKFHDFKRFSSLGIKVGITLGDYDSSDSHIFEAFDIVISTNEKIDSLLRHNKSFMHSTVSLLVIDECHLIDDATRGPTLETLIVKIKRINPDIQLLALSATVHNAEELAFWLNATLIQSNWRSVPIEEYFCNQHGLVLHKNSQSTRTISTGNILEALVYETLSDKGQVLIFANSRKIAQSMATSLKIVTKSYLSTSDVKEIASSITTLVKKDQTGDKTSDSLLQLLKLGVGFHHAGLSSEQRSIVETLFKKRIIKAIVATPTLAAGINLPARRVIIPSIWRFSTSTGNMAPIKIMEYEQMRGRSGRPRYDSVGESFVLASSERDEEIVLSKYFSSEDSEDIESKLSSKPTLRIHLLGVLATGIVKTYGEVKTFLEETFFGFHYNNFSLLEKNLKDVLTDLENFGFIKLKNEQIVVTRLGKRVSQLYVDPVSANIIIKGMIKSLAYPEYNPLMFIHIFCLVPDIRRIRLRKKDWEKIYTLYDATKQKLLSDSKVIWNFDYENDLEAFKTALIMIDWIDELSLPELLGKHDLTLGDFQRLLETVVWLSYSAKELTKELIKILQEKDLTDFIYVQSLSSYSPQDINLLYKYLSGIEIRLSEGIKEDLLSIIELKGLGRVKSRTLVQAGITSLEKLKLASPEQLIKLSGFGIKLVQSLKEQLGQSFSVNTISGQKVTNFNTKTRTSKTNKKTSSLIDFIKK